ncbi:hypothetical protein C1T31_13365 [Hanstruepera neustonica]|uniref:NodB homology domain-containing protein n=1 Tax=Hanstruepera neustonica TaxID=1445657 RepID=A0A2K1DVU9_9FLAO|nr:hypothetical protein [Hanstruepera neustonica]PNQ72089.1 hypothetical protein C1T31_13365 [Hanstruepera neustonica]
MVESINLIIGKKSKKCLFDKHHDFKITIDSSFLESRSCTIEIVFNCDIIQFRNHDYTWVAVTKNHIANWHSPKIIKLENNQLIQANQQLGVWEVDASQKHILLWHLNPRYSKPLAQYDLDNSKRIVDGFHIDALTTSLGLLFVKDYGIEISRSQVPFSAVTCFTDHCDFDSVENLKQQRAFFKKYQVKLTKGFFLNHYSKHDFSASYEHHSEEYKKWLDDGHELAYHSFSQSIKPISDSLNDFQNFKQVLPSISTYIDHGFQPYNVSLYKNYEQINNDYGTVLNERGVKNLWNYVDTGTAVKGVINQINPNQFTLDTFRRGIADLDWKTRQSMFIKNTIFHYFNNDYSLHLYRFIARYFKTIGRKKSFSKHLQLFKNGLKVIRLFIPILFFWQKRKHSIYPLAKFSPVIFKHDITGKSFTVFQTLEMIDFKLGLCQNNLDLLIAERGLFIAHTYFSAPMNYHQGKLFGKVDEIDAQVEKNFDYLSQKIRSKEIWNPTLTELIHYLRQMETIVFDCDSEGQLIVHHQNQLKTRKVS